ncbi:MAG: sigma-70 factor domain-containing protein, partial [Gammaproteobacteria bacterium]
MTDHERDRMPEPEEEMLPDAEAEESLEGDSLPDDEQQAPQLGGEVATALRADPVEPEPQFGEDQLDATRIYLSEIGYSALLTAEEEVYYARRA